MTTFVRTLLAAALLFAAGCDRAPESFAPPAQRQPVLDPDAGGMLIEMDSPRLSQHIVKDIYDTYDSPWRWTGQEPTLKISLPSAQNLKLSADFTLWEEAFRQTGPLDLQFIVNGHALDSVNYTTPGPKHFQEPVPSNWLSTASDTILSIRVSKMYVAPEDSKKFGIILTRIGFVQ